MTTHVAQPRVLSPVTVEELMEDHEEALDTVHWQWTGMGRNASVGVCGLFQTTAKFAVGQLRHVLLCAHRDADQHRPAGPSGLEFRVVTASGRRAIISSDDDVKVVFKACSRNGLKNSRALLDAMRRQGDHQVGMDAAML